MTDEETVKVNCSYCCKEIECPIGLLDKVEKHACVDCFENLPKDKDNLTKVHVDIPMNDVMDDIADEFVKKQIKELVPEIWAKHKDEMKEMSKRELAEKMFDEGMYIGFIGAFTYSATMAEEKEDMGEEK